MNTLSQRLAAQADPKEIISELIAQNNLEILQETLKNCKFLFPNKILSLFFHSVK